MEAEGGEDVGESGAELEAVEERGFVWAGQAVEDDPGEDRGPEVVAGFGRFGRGREIERGCGEGFCEGSGGCDEVRG